MRLIDADKFEAFMYQNNNDDFNNGVQFVLEMIDKAPTVCDIERIGKLISDLIQQIEDKENKFKQIRENIEKEEKAFKSIDKQMANAFNESLKIIDKYMEK